MFGWLLDRFCNDIAIDLGTATTLIYRRGKGIVLTEPSVLAIQADYRGSRSVYAVGEDAKRLLGRSPDNIDTVRPIRHGVVSNATTAQGMLAELMQRSTGARSIVRPRVVLAVPSGASEVERRAVRECALQAGACKVRLIEEPMAAAIGAGLDISLPVGRMIVDIGGGTTDIAVISSHGVVYSESTRVAGDEMDQTIIGAIRNLYNLEIGVQTAEAIKIELGSADDCGEIRSMMVKGQDRYAAVPHTIEIKSDEVRRALTAPIDSIVERIRVVLQFIPPEISADIVDEGILLVGGGAQLENLDAVVARNTGLDVRVPQNPHECVALGAGQCLEDRTLLAQVRIPIW